MLLFSHKITYKYILAIIILSKGKNNGKEVERLLKKEILAKVLVLPLTIHTFQG